MQLLARLFIIVSVLMFPYRLLAHGYWIEIEGTNKVKEPFTIKLFFGDYPAGERLSGKTLDKMKDIKVYVIAPNGEKQQVAMTQFNEYWKGTFTPWTAGMYEVTSINDEREVQDWTKHNLGITRPIQYLKMSYPVGKAAAQNPSLYLDAMVNKISSDVYEVSVSKNGSSLPSQKVVLASFNDGEKELITDGNGKVKFSVEKPALYLLSIDWIDSTPGAFRQKK